MKAANNLFLVDDDDIFVFLTLKVIEETKLANKVDVFTNGKTAIDSLKKLVETNGVLPEIILLDLNMPILDGWGFLTEYQALNLSLDKKITIYIVSSSISPRDLEKAKNISAVSDFIIKPLEKHRFEEAVRRLNQ
jgi:CheY-like chemotaxis protein